MPRRCGRSDLLWAQSFAQWTEAGVLRVFIKPVGNDLGTERNVVRIGFRQISGPCLAVKGILATRGDARVEARFRGNELARGEVALVLRSEFSAPSLGAETPKTVRLSRRWEDKSERGRPMWRLACDHFECASLRILRIEPSNCNPFSAESHDASSCGGVGVSLSVCFT